MLPLSVAIITKDEAHNLPRLFESLKPLDPAEIVVLDSGSQDKTVTIAKSYGARVVETDWRGFVEQKNRALNECIQPWILSLDADEPISEDLARSINQLFQKNRNEPPKAGYEINRRTWYLGAWLKYCWTPEWRLRLVKKEYSHWTGDRIHERLAINGSTARITGDIFHFSYDGISDHYTRAIRYAQISAEVLYVNGKRPKLRHLTLNPLARFLKILLLQQGWRDGWRGWLIAWSSMIAGFLKYAFLYELQRQVNNDQNT